MQSRRADTPDPLSYPQTTPPAQGGMAEVAPGIFWIRMPLPFALDHVNLWALDDGKSWTLVDTGLGGERTRHLWTQLLDGPLAGKPVGRLIVTHYHPDHIGSANWLVRRTGAAMAISRTEILRAGTLALDTSFTYREAVAAFYSRAGVSPELQTRLLESGSNAYSRNADPPPLPYLRLKAGGRLEIGGRIWEIVIGQGHSPEMACLFAPEDKILIAGDQILPHITPNIGVFADQPGADPLNDFLTSLDRFRMLPEDSFVLPSHGLPFSGLWERIAALKAHHAERLDRVLASAAAPQSLAAVTETLFRRSLDPHQMGFALGEALAHVNYLVERERMAAHPGTDGITRYVRKI